MYLYKTANSLKVSKTCFSLDKKFTTIIPEIVIFFVYPLVGPSWVLEIVGRIFIQLLYENSLYNFKDPKFLIQ